jgi:hypothetical protein
MKQVRMMTAPKKTIPKNYPKKNTQKKYPKNTQKKRPTCIGRFIRVGLC